MDQDLKPVTKTFLIKLGENNTFEWEDEINSGLKWKLKFFPIDEEQNIFIEEISFLEKNDVTIETDFLVKFLNKDPKKSIPLKEKSFRLTKENREDGYKKLSNIQKLGEEFQEDGQLRIEIRLNLNFNIDYSMEIVKYNGLKNQGATCYMNSLLQALYHLSMFRKAVYNLPTENEKIEESIPFALQRLFYMLQFGEFPVGTKELTKSFGWTSREVFVQHDAQELNRVLFDALEEKMKNTPSEGILDEMFKGEFLNFIKCINVDYSSNRVEPFLDLQLVVKGCKTIYDSLDKYIEVEQLDGKNQYNAEGHGLQDAKKGVILKNLPPVLFLHLRRFDFNFETLKNYKVNDKCEFYDTIDLDKYVHKEGEDPYNKSTKYQLHGVLVHTGSISAGHYFAYFRPTPENKWYKFNDSNVTRVPPKQAINKTWGENSEYSREANAYMLVYIRDTDVNDVLSEVTASVIPPHIKKQFEEEELEKKRKALEKIEAEKYFTFKLVFDQDFKNHTSVDLINTNYQGKENQVLKILKEDKISDICEEIEKRFNIPKNKFRMWFFNERKNKTLRPSKPKVIDDYNNVLSDIFSRTLSEKYIFVEVPQELLTTKGTIFDPTQFLAEGDYEEFQFSPEHEIVLFPKFSNICHLFFKFYDKEKQTLEYAGRLYVHKKTPFGEIKKLLTKWRDLPENESLTLYEEYKFDPPVLNSIQDTSDVESSKLISGDIIVFQLEEKKPEGEENTEENKENTTTDEEKKILSAPEYFNWLAYSIDISFRKLDAPEEEMCLLKLDLRSSYDNVSLILGKKLGLENPENLRFTRYSFIYQGPQAFPLDPKYNENLITMITNTASSNKMPILYYEILPFSLRELLKKIIVEVLVTNEKTETLFDGIIYLDKENANAEHLKELVIQKHFSHLEEKPEMRLMQLNNHSQIFSLHSKNYTFSQSKNKFLLECCSKEESEMEKGDLLIAVQHIESNNYIFGNPFMFVVKKDEKLESVKKRIQAKLQIEDNEFKNWKFMAQDWSGPTKNTDDDFVITSERKFEDPKIMMYLAMRHTDVNKKAGSSSREEGIVIKKTISNVTSTTEKKN
eukprot:TRINITY_DN4079_c0_g3_i1.p1 TRINITY_DN4079_c0_g3~~TRINITY_DN4079_c0_g3_i1.p1  ORF type:complete len:1076 (-),score=375.30 TRINITY_DN4079_c0_g3_i1:2-3229(-)